MVRYYRFAKTLAGGNTYKLPPDRFYVIKRVGTDSASDITIRIDGIPVLTVRDEFAPIRKTSSNLLGPLDLKQLYLVAPPNKLLQVEGTGNVRIEGVLGILGPGESLPAEYQSRFNMQGKQMITAVTGSYTVGTSWAANAEYTVLELTPKSNEKYVFNKIAMAKVTNHTLSVGEIAMIFYLEGEPLDILTDEPGHKGIDIYYAPYPPSDTDGEEPFSLEANPIVVEGDNTLKVTMMNVSGSTITETASMVAQVLLLAEYYKT